MAPPMSALGHQRTERDRIMCALSPEADIRPRHCRAMASGHLSAASSLGASVLPSFFVWETAGLMFVRHRCLQSW